MITLGLKNYCKSYKHFFIPLGALSLGIVIGLSIMIPMILGAIKAFVSGVAEVIGNTSFHWEDVGDTLLAALDKLNWADPQAILDELSTSEYWTELLRDCAAAAFGDTSAAQEQISALTEKAISTIVTGMGLFTFFTMVGGLVGYYVTRSSIRAGVAKRSFWKSILATVISTVINLAIIAGGVVLVSFFRKVAILSIIVVILVYGFAAFLEAYFVHGYKKVPFKKAVKISNCFLLFLLTIIEILIMFAIFALLKGVTNTAIALYAGFSVFVITVSCLQLNAEAYVKSLANNPTIEKPGTIELSAAYQGLAPISFSAEKKQDGVEEITESATEEGGVEVASEEKHDAE